MFSLETFNSYNLIALAGLENKLGAALPKLRILFSTSLHPEVLIQGFLSETIHFKMLLIDCNAFSAL